MRVLVALVVAPVSYMVHHGRAAAIEPRIDTVRSAAQAIPLAGQAYQKTSPLLRQMGSLTPTASGPGIVVCDPVSSDKTMADFGIGCGRWLHLVVSGHPEFGKTPLWHSLDRVRQDLGRPDLAFSQDTAIKFSRILGSTHFAVGQIQGDSHSLRLSYRLWDAAARKPVGVPMMIAGSPDHVLRGLPGLARRLTLLLGVRSPRVPASIGATPAQMRFIGQAVWCRDPSRQATLQEQLQPLAPRMPLAGLCCMAPLADRNVHRWNELASRILEKAPENATVWGAVGWTDNTQLSTRRSQIAQLLHRFPSNYQFAACRAAILRQDHRWKDRATAALQAVRDSPSSPDAWHSLGTALADMGEGIRYGRLASDLSDADSSALDVIYPQWLAANCRAAILDPTSGEMWLEVARAACFYGDDELADAAFWKSGMLSATVGPLYYWGLQMYQPKWGGSPSSLARVARLAVDKPWTKADSAWKIADGLRDAGFQLDAQQVIDQFIQRCQQASAHTPADSSAQHELARILDDEKRIADSAIAYRAYLRLEPEDAVGHREYGVVLDHLQKLNDSILELQTALRLDPDCPDVHLRLGRAYKQTGQVDPAVTELRKAVHENPFSSDAHFALGEALDLKQSKNQAAAEYMQAVTLSPHTVESYMALYQLLSDRKHYDAAADAANSALRLSPTYAQAHVAAGFAYAMEGKFDLSIQENRAAILIDPNNATAHENLGDALSDTGHKAEARKEWQLVLTLDHGTDAQEAQQMLARNP